MSIEKDQIIKIRVSSEERKAIELRMKQMQVLNMSAFIRKMAINGLCVRLNLEDIRELSYQVNRLGNNLNQYAKWANQSGAVYVKNMETLMGQFEEVIRKENEILRKLADL
ncbi:MAG: plasmid mobilization protein [Candidatus Weimeria sp.]